MKTEFNAREAIIEKFCRLIVAAGERGAKPFEFFPARSPEAVGAAIEIARALLPYPSYAQSLRSLAGEQRPRIDG